MSSGKIDSTTREKLLSILDEAVSDKFLVTFNYDLNKGHDEFKELLMNDAWDDLCVDGKPLPNTTLQRFFLARSAAIAKKLAVASIVRVEKTLAGSKGFRGFKVTCYYISAEIMP